MYCTVRVLVYSLPGTVYYCIQLELPGSYSYHTSSWECFGLCLFCSLPLTALAGGGVGKLVGGCDAVALFCSVPVRVQRVCVAPFVRVRPHPRTPPPCVFLSCLFPRTTTQSEHSTTTCS